MKKIYSLLLVGGTLLSQPTIASTQNEDFIQTDEESFNIVEEVPENHQIHSTVNPSETDWETITVPPYSKPFNILGKPFCAMSLPGREELFVGVEPLTDEAVSFFKKRLAYEVGMLFGKEIETERQEILRSFFYGASHSIEELYQMSERNKHDSDTMFNDMIPPGMSFVSKNFEDFCKLGGALPKDDPELMELHEKYAPEKVNPQKADGYFSAWFAFMRNLDERHNNSYFSYVSSKPIQGPISTQFSPTSTDLKMQMTLCLMDGMECPAGICRSLLGTYHDMETGVDNRGLSIPFHTGTAALIQDNIKSSIDYLTVRPWGSMGRILEKAGIPYTKTPGGIKEESNLPYMRGLKYSPLLKDDLLNPGTPFELVDPRKKKSYLIKSGGWFSKNTFYGGVTFEGFQALPFYTMRIEDMRKALMANEGD